MNIKIKCYRKDCEHWYRGNCELTEITLFLEDTFGCATYEHKINENKEVL